MRLLRVQRWALLLWAAASAAMGTLAQEVVNHASVSGQVTDPSGAVVEGARVTARHVDTNLTSEVMTNGEGRFRIPYLRIGRYEIAVRKQGFAEAARTFTATAGAAFQWPVVLGVASIQSFLTVESGGAPLEGARSQIAATVSRAEISNLPLNGRSFLDVALLVPGVSPTNTASTQLFPETSAIPGQGISISSQRNFSNNFIVDGLSANDDAAGLSGVLHSLEAVSEVQVVTSGGQAEFGRALGGYVNVVTKGGTNTVHGSLYGYFRNHRLNANNALSQTRLPMTQAQYGASLGGPIVRDRAFHFLSFEQRVLNQSGLVTIAPADAAAINARLDKVGYPSSRIATGRYPNPVHNTNLLARVDHQLSRGIQLTARYSLYDVGSRNTRGAGALSAASASAGLDSRDDTLAIASVATLSPRMVNETRAEFTWSNLRAAPADAVGPAVSIAGVAAFGRLSSSPTGRRNDLFQIVDNLSYQAGAHAVRVGIDYLSNELVITFPRSIRGSYSFASLIDFLNGTYNNLGFSQTFGNSIAAQTNRNLGLYGQDEWAIGSRLTLNLGLRHDLQFLETISTDVNNVSPRAGFVWTPTASRRTLIRGSFGLFYDRVPLRAVANALLSSRNTTTLSSSSQVSLSLSPSQSGAPVFPNILTGLPPGVLANFTTMDRHMQNAYSQQAGFEIQRKLTASTSVSVGVERLRGLHLIMSANQNAPRCAASGGNNACRPNPAYANNNQYSPLADSRYEGLHVSVLQQPTRWGSYRVSYTYSKAYANVGEFFFSSPIDNLNIWRDWGRSDDDQRHRLVLNGMLDCFAASARTPWGRICRGFQLSGMMQYYSALPFDVKTGANTVQGTAARPMVGGAFIPRNAGTAFTLFNVSVRLARSFQVTDRLRAEGLAEAFNVLNRVNGLTINGTFGAGAYPANPLPSFRRLTATGDPRSMQLALRLMF